MDFIPRKVKRKKTIKDWFQIICRCWNTNLALHNIGKVDIIYTATCSSFWFKHLGRTESCLDSCTIGFCLMDGCNYAQSLDDMTMPPPNHDRDYTKELQEFIIHLSEQPGRESVASEIEGK